jgi:hypothetical protein
MVELGKEKEKIVTEEKFDLTSAGDGSSDIMHRVFIQLRSK